MMTSTNIIDMLQQGVYLDKTHMYLKLLVHRGNLFIIRPRRFGKTLLLNTIDKIACGGDYKEGFRNTYIYNGPLTNSNGKYIDNDRKLSEVPVKYNWSKYPVMRFGFLAMRDCSINSIIDSLLDQLDEIRDRYSIQKEQLERYLDMENKPKRYSEEENTYLENRMSISKRYMKNTIQLLLGLDREIYQDKVVILVDEYDSIFTSPGLEGDEKYRKQINEFVGMFYESLKVHESNLCLKLITGVTMLKLDKEYSPLVSCDNISLDTKFSALLGYTKDEILSQFNDEAFIFVYNTQNRLSLNAELIDENKMNTIKNEIMDGLGEWYDGYMFSPDGVRIFNPCSVNACFNKGRFSGYWDRTMKTDWQWYMLRENVPFFKRLLINGEIPNINENQLICTGRDCEGDEETLCITMMYQTGLLTIQSAVWLESGEYRYTLNFPNKEVIKSLDYTVNNINKAKMTHNKSTYAKDFKVSFENENWSEFCRLMWVLYNNMLYGMLQHTFEQTFQGMLQVAFYMIGWKIPLECSLKGGKRMDGCYVLNGKKYIFEYKRNTYVCGPRTKFKGAYQAYFQYYPHTNTRKEEVTIIAINFLDKPIERGSKSMKADENRVRYLGVDDYNNIYNVSQLIVIVLNKNGSEKSKTEYIPRENGIPDMIKHPVNNKNWNQRMDEYSRNHGGD
eukprot:GAHX01001470.1.p1 GENE.GAHX01001470.1~~GAHX01001470.1.p1  ORF type:complete len:674 (-),score=99.36 GAHX01001470.1:220-2241(-)